MRMSAMHGFLVASFTGPSGDRREVVDQGREGLCKVCKGWLTRAERGTGSVGGSVYIPFLLLE